MADIKGGVVDKILFRTDNKYGSTKGNITINNLTIYFGHWRPDSSSLKTSYWMNYAYVDDLTLIYKGNHTFNYPGINGAYLELDVNDTFIYNGNKKLFYELWYTDRVEDVGDGYYAQLDAMYGQAPYSNGFETVQGISYEATKGNLLPGYALSMRIISKGSYPSNVSLDFGDDGMQEWNYSSELRTKEYNTNLTAHLNPDVPHNNTTLIF